MSALFRGMLQDYPYDTFGERPLCLILVWVIIIWRNRHG